MSLALPALALETTLGGLALAVQTGPAAAPLGTTLATPRSSSALHELLHALLAHVHLTPPEIQTLGVSMGPGSFTGARVAVAVAEAWQLANPSCRVVPLPSLTLAAHAVRADHAPTQPFRVLVDAAGGHAYGQDFSPDLTPLTPATCLPLREASATTLPVAACNLPLLEARWHLRPLTPSALMAALQAQAKQTTLPLEPVYLKPLTYHALHG